MANLPVHSHSYVYIAQYSSLMVNVVLNLYTIMRELPPNTSIFLTSGTSVNFNSDMLEYEL